METKRAIKLLDTKLQNPFRIMALKKLQTTANPQLKLPIQCYTEKTSIYYKGFKS